MAVDEMLGRHVDRCGAPGQRALRRQQGLEFFRKTEHVASSKQALRFRSNPARADRQLQYTMKFCIYGAGAVGGLIAGWLARSGQNVSIVARGPHLEAIRRHGLRVRDRATGGIESFRIEADSDPVKLGLQDYVIVAVKGQSLTGVAENISRLCSEKTTIVT